MSKQAMIRSADTPIEVPDGKTVLECALDSGIDYPHGCRSGRCGSCKSRLIYGEVELLKHTEFALSAEERERGLILACRALPQTNIAVAWLGGDEETTDHSRRELICRVTALDDATHDIKRVRLSVRGNESLAYMAGQYARVTFPGAPTRDYSMANRADLDELEFHVRRIPGGAASERVATHLAVGDEVVVEGPFGTSFLREKHTGPIMAVAGGSGLAPIKAIVETALFRGLHQPIHVYFGVHTDQDLYLVEHFMKLAQSYENFHFIPVISKEKTSSWRRGWVTDAIADDFEDFDGWKAYVAGPPAMVDAARAVLVGRGLRPEDLHADVFFTPEALETVDD